MVPYPFSCIYCFFPHILFNFSANESREVSHLLITDALVPVSEDEEKKSREEDVDKSRKGGLKRKTPVSKSQGVIHTS